MCQSVSGLTAEESKDALLLSHLMGIPEAALREQLGLGHRAYLARMPTLSVTKPDTYEPWEHPEPLPFDTGAGPVKDAAAMGRVWYLEGLACRRTGA